MILDYSNYIHLTGEKGIVNYHSVENTIDELYKEKGICPFCNKKIENKVYHAFNDKIEWCSAYEEEDVIQCEYCGWWEHSYIFRSDDITDGLRATSLRIDRGILREYDIASKEIPINILNNYIKKNPDKIFGINDKKMEELTKSVFRDFYDGEIKIVGKSHDGGKDLILINGKDKTFIQVKRRTQQDKVEPVSSIRDLLGASILEGAKSCIFVTTADHFSLPAKKAAEKAEKKRIVNQFELIDYHRFVDMLQLQKNTVPDVWKNVLNIRK